MSIWTHTSQSLLVCWLQVWRHIPHQMLGTLGTQDQHWTQWTRQTTCRQSGLLKIREGMTKLELFHYNTYKPLSEKLTGHVRELGIKIPYLVLVWILHKGIGINTTVCWESLVYFPALPQRNPASKKNNLTWMKRVC